ncbi:hypothetical protein T484DRAFT_1849795 [Baffinella frigidus]|nr:hypothetical protein T484DRAFT_1849795 [Cryptophyta sp. CCMP2293]
MRDLRNHCLTKASRNKAIFKRFDVNADGQLTEEEFLYPKSGGRGGKESRQKAQMKEARARRGAGSGELDDTKDA